jgi:hypothetical protein
MKEQTGRASPFLKAFDRLNLSKIAKAKGSTGMAFY